MAAQELEELAVRKLMESEEADNDGRLPAGPFGRNLIDSTAPGLEAIIANALDNLRNEIDSDCVVARSPERAHESTTSTSDLENRISALDVCFQPAQGRLL
jgi:hypothetical protein